jgi:hypothetical protein
MTAPSAPRDAWQECAVDGDQMTSTYLTSTALLP